MLLNRVLQSSLSAIYPPLCLACHAPVDRTGGLCGPCWRDLRILPEGCTTCAAPLPSLQPGEVAHCDDCLRLPRTWRRGVAAFEYAGTGRALVLALKHGDRTEVAKPAATWLTRALAPSDWQDLLILPIPLHRRRRLSRKFNQSALIAGQMARQLGCDWLPDGLLRPKRTPSLNGMSVDDRFATLGDAILPNPRHDITGRKVLIVDDVMTSGATFSAATQACYSAGAKDVCVAALARVLKESYI